MTCGALAERYYGDGRDWRKIAAANPKVLTGGPDRLQIGWRLKIPDPDAAVSDESRRIVTVRRGDTLSSIAERELGSGVALEGDLPRKPRPSSATPTSYAVGMQLVLPKPQKSATTATSAPRIINTAGRSGTRARGPSRAAESEPSAAPAQTRRPSCGDVLPSVPTNHRRPTVRL